MLSVLHPRSWGQSTSSAEAQRSQKQQSEVDQELGSGMEASQSPPFAVCKNVTQGPA